MSLPCTRKANESQPRQRLGAAVSVGVALATLALASSAQAQMNGTVSPAGPGAIRFCVDEANPLAPTDRAVAQAAAAKAGVQAVVVSYNSSGAVTDSDGDDAKIDPAKLYAKMAKTCDLIMGVPVVADQPSVPSGFTATPTYLRTGFVMVTTGGPIGSFATMAKRGDIGVDYLTVPINYFDDATVHAEHVYYSNPEALAALLKGEVHAAMLWQPWLVQEEAAHPHGLRTSQINMPDAAWGVVAFYTPQAAGQARIFNQGLVRLRQTGQLKMLVAPYQAAGE